MEAIMASPLEVVQALPLFLWMPLIFIIVLVTGTYLASTIRYHLILRQYHAYAPPPHGSKASPDALATLPLPYKLPWVGHTLEFLTPIPGAFWTSIQAALPAVAGGACSTVLAGKRNHILLSPVSMAALTHNRTLGRHEISRDVAVALTDSTPHDQNQHTIPGAKAGRSLDEGMFNEYLLRADRVQELMARFMTELRAMLADDPAFNADGSAPDQEATPFQAWLWPRVFRASVTTIFGRELLAKNPSLPADYLAYEESATKLLYAYPRWLAPGVYRARDRILKGIERWLSDALEASEGKIPDAGAGPAWDECWGSRLMRAYHRTCQTLGQSPRQVAPLVMGLFFASNANTVPATLWTLVHLLDTTAGDPTLLPRVRAEVESVPEAADGTLDLKRLMELPLLQSVYAEVLRLYVDVIIARDLKSEVTLPIGHGGDGAPKVRLPKGDTVTASSWTVHRDSSAWPGVPPSQFDGDRFLVADEKGQKVFTLGTPGRWAPYGGGRPMCPGRLLAKQEIMVTVALVLRMYDFELVGYVNSQGKRTEKFPGVKSKLPGGGFMSADGDFLLRIKRRNKDIKAP